MASLLKERAVLKLRQLIFAALSGSLTHCAPACAGLPRFPGSALGSWTSPVPCVYVLALLAPSLRAARSRPNSHAHSLSLTSSARAPLLVSTSWCPLLQASTSKLLHLGFPSPAHLPTRAFSIIVTQASSFSVQAATSLDSLSVSDGGDGPEAGTGAVDMDRWTPKSVPSIPDNDSRFAMHVFLMQWPVTET